MICVRHWHLAVLTLLLGLIVIRGELNTQDRQDDLRVACESRAGNIMVANDRARAIVAVYAASGTEQDLKLAKIWQDSILTVPTCRERTW